MHSGLQGVVGGTPHQIHPDGSSPTRGSAPSAARASDTAFQEFGGLLREDTEPSPARYTAPRRICARVAAGRPNLADLPLGRRRPSGPVAVGSVSWLHPVDVAVG